MQARLLRKMEQSMEAPNSNPKRIKCISLCLKPPYCSHDELDYEVHLFSATVLRGRISAIEALMTTRTMQAKSRIASKGIHSKPGRPLSPVPQTRNRTWPSRGFLNEIVLTRREALCSLRLVRERYEAMLCYTTVLRTVGCNP